MADYTIYAETSDYDIFSLGDSWSNARSSGGGAYAFDANDASEAVVAVAAYDAGSIIPGSYLITDSLFGFDASAVPSGTDSSILLSLAVSSNDGASGRTLEVYEHSWTSGTSSWVQGSSRGGLTIAGTMTTGTGTRTASLSILPRTLYKLMVSDQRVRTNTTPGAPGETGSSISFHSANASGTTNDPKITLTVAVAGGGSGNFLAFF